MKFFYYLFLISTFLISSCTKKEKETTIDTFSSPKSLYIDYISAYTSGVLSRRSEIKVKLASPVKGAIAGERTNLKLFSFDPDIEGETYWENSRSIVFKPVSMLKVNTRYQVTFDLVAVITDVRKENEEFRFTFQTIAQNYETIAGGFQLYNSATLDRVRLTGVIQTADYAIPEKVEEMLQAVQDNKSLGIIWEHSNLNREHKYTIENVLRKEKEDNVTLQIKGDPIGVNKDDKLKIEIPALGDYKVISTRIVRGVSDQYISILFSDPLDEKQNLSGLVILGNIIGAPRVVVNINELKIYPTQQIQGEVQLVVFMELKNSAGYQLKEDFKTSLQFSQQKPEVRIIGGDKGAIIPNSDGLVMPFEAIGLTAVDVSVIRIFEDNVLQYLQINEIGGNYQLSRVGRPVAHRTIQLNNTGVTDLNKWNRYTLDLADILQANPGAIYMVKIGFKKRYSNYFCPSDTEDGYDDIDELEESWSAQVESSNWDSYEYYYSSNYNWEERDNPCSPSYYGDRRSVQKVLFASDLGLIAKKGEGDEILIFVTNMLNTDPIGGVDLTVYDYQQQPIGTASTDKNGIATISFDGLPFVVTAKKGLQTGYLKLDDGSSLSLSNFDITGSKVQHGIKGFIYGERGVWRPADTVHLAFIMAKTNEPLPDNHPVIMELWNPMDQLFTKRMSVKSVGGIYRFDIITPKDAPTGNWLAKVKVGGAVFSKRVKIETIKPNRLKIDLDFGKERLTVLDKNISGDLNVRWLHGAKASNLKANFELLLNPTKTTFPGYPNFVFDDVSRDFYSESQVIFDGRLNEEGYARVNIAINVDNNAPGALNAIFKGKVFEEGGDFSIDKFSIPFYPYKSFAGLKTPKGDKRGILLTDKKHPVRIATVDANGNPVDRKNVKVQLYKLNWKWWWDNSWENLSNYVGRSYREPLKTSRINTANGEGEWVLEIKYPDWGRYYIQVTDPVSGHSAGQIVYVDWPGWAGKGKKGELGGASMLELLIENKEYKVGETVKISIPSALGNRALVSLETGSEVLQAFWVETKEEITSISFKATRNMSPNIYAHITMLQPHGQTFNDLPIRLYGVHNINIVNEETRLKPIISMSQELRPEEEFSITVKEQNGKAMAYTLAVVDEGLLDITRFKTPDPWSSFFAREALGVKTWDMYDHVIGAYGGKLERLLSIGGDEDIQPKDEKDVNRFKPVVMFLGPYNLKEGKSANHMLKMPQYIGSVRTMVVAAGDGAYGMAEKAIPVKQPLMVLATLPRVAGPGEEIVLPVNVFVMNDNIREVNVTVESTGTLELVDKKSVKLNFSEAGDQVVYFKLKAGRQPGPGKVVVKVISGSLSASYDINLNVTPRNPLITDVNEQVIAPGESWSYAYKKLGLPGTNDCVIEMSTMPPLNIEQRLSFLIRYPHGCIEQTTSAVFAQLYLDKLTDLDQGKKDRIESNIKAAIERLKSFQLSSGGFAYWPGNNYPNSWGTTYAGHFLIEAKKRGYHVQDGMLSSWLGFQEQRALNWDLNSDDQNNDLAQAYRLYTLALADHPAISAMNRMKENQAISRRAKWRLALTYATGGYELEAIAIAQALSTEITTRENYSATFGSAHRDKAMILETLVKLGRMEDAFSLLKDLAVEMGDSKRWMSTQTTAYCFIAIAEYAGSFPLEESMDISVEAGSGKKNIKTKAFFNQVSVADPEKDIPVKLQNHGNVPVFTRIIRKGVPLEGNEINDEKNIRMRIAYLDMKGNPVDISSLSQGTDFMAEISVTNPGLKGRYNEIALTQIFPSGWEIINTRLDDTEQFYQQDKAKYTDIRDDRVMHYFDITPNKKLTFRVLLNASYRGRYYLPAIKTEAMYDHSIYAIKAGKWVEVTEDK